MASRTLTSTEARGNQRLCVVRDQAKTLTHAVIAVISKAEKRVPQQ